VEGDYVYLLYPPDPRSTLATTEGGPCWLSEEGCRISTFALIEDYWGMDWVRLRSNQLSKLTKGVAFYTAAG